MTPPLAPTLVSDLAGITLVDEYLSTADVFGYDLETNFTNDWFARKIRTITLGTKDRQFIIDLLGFAQNEEVLKASQGNFGAAAELVFGPLLKLLDKYLNSNKCLKVGTNLQFDYETLKWNLGIRAWHFYDCLLAEKCLYAGEVHFMATGFWALENLVARYCGLELTDVESGKGFDLCTPLTPHQLDYCALDVRLPLAVRFGQIRRLEKENLAVCAQIEFDAIPPFGDIHLNGLLVDEQQWKAIIDQTRSRQQFIVSKMDEKFIRVVGTKTVGDKDVIQRDAIEKKWREETDKELRKEFRIKFMAKRKEISDRLKKADECEGEAFINYGSNKQLKEALWKMGYKKTQLPDTGDPVLEALATPEVAKWDVQEAFDKDPELTKFSIIDLLRLYRSTAKVLTTYGWQWIRSDEFEDEFSGKTKKGFVHSNTGRIHSNINQYGAATGRTSSTNPNVQNIPRGSDFRSCFVSRPGFKFVTVDMSGAELRILAEMSGEPIWVDAFAKGWDVHSVCAEIIFEGEWKDGAEQGCAYYAKHQKCKCKKHKKLREICKTLNFGLAYGMGPKRLADGVGITYEHALEVFEKFKRSFPVVFNFLEKLGQYAVMSLEARDMTGRRRKWARPSTEKAKKLLEEDMKGTDKHPTSDDIRRKLKGLYGSIEREGKNCPIQGTNASLIKLAMGCGFAPDGTPFLWHVLEPKYGSYMVNMVHDELCSEAPDAVAEEVKQTVGGAFTKASAVFMKTVVMEWEGSVDTKWSK